jgi:hypothetical protein
MILSHALRAVQKASAIPISVDYQTVVDDSADRTTYTFSNVSIGGAGLIVVASHTEGAGVPLVSMTIGGVSATIDVQVSSATGTRTNTAICSAVITSGSTATIVVNYTGVVARCGIAVYRVQNYTSVTPVTTASNSANSGTGLSATLNSLSVNDAVIAAYTTGDNNAITWTNITERYDQSVGGEQSRESGGNATVGSSGNYTVTTSNTNSTQGITLVAAAWR